MSKLRILLPSLGLAVLILNGCIVTQAQVFANFALPSPFTINSASDPFEPSEQALVGDAQALVE